MVRKHVLAASTLLAASASAVQATPVEWAVSSGGNGHFYELVTETVAWDSALTSAGGMSHLGMTGYLATVTSEAEHDFLSSMVNPSGTTAWLGGSDEETEGVWKWVAGPEAGEIFWNGASGGSSPTYARWNPGEPNGGSGENYLEGWLTTTGNWNDAGPAVMNAYVVEYSAATAAVPLPAAAPLLAAGLGALALTRRRRRG